MKKILVFICTIVLLLGFVGEVIAVPISIGGISYDQSGPTESVTAIFTQAEGGVSTGTYTGLVELEVSGVGQSLGTRYNDAFYVYTGGFYHDASYYQLALDDTTLIPFNPSQDAKNFIVYDLDAGIEVTPTYVPTYQSDHIYNFVVDLGLLGVSMPSTLHFGASNGNFSDNSGSYNIDITQLASVPEPATCILLLFGFVGLIGIKKKLG